LFTLPVSDVIPEKNPGSAPDTTDLGRLNDGTGVSFSGLTTNLKLQQKLTFLKYYKDYSDINN